MKTAVIVIDMLNDFVTGNLATERALPIIPNIQALVQKAREHGDVVVFGNDAHLPQGDAEFKIWGPHAIAGTPGAQVIPELQPQPGDFIVPKRRYSGFLGTDLSFILRENNVQVVIICGLHTNICVRHTCNDAFVEGYTTIVPSDAVNAFTEKDHREGLDYLKQVYGATVMSTQEILANWDHLYERATAQQERVPA